MINSISPTPRRWIRTASPPLWLDPIALLGADLATVLAGLQQGLQTPEHLTFVDAIDDLLGPSLNSPLAAAIARVIP